MDGQNFQTRSRSFAPVFAYFVLCLMWNVPSAFPQDSVPDPEIRQQAQQILNEPEFRYFEHLGDSPERPLSRGGRRSASIGSGNSNSGGGPGDESSGRKNADGSSTPSRTRSKTNRENASPASESNKSSDSTSRSWGGGVGALGNIIGLIFHGLAYLVLIAVCGLILYLIVLAILNRESTPSAIGSPLANFSLPQETEDHPPGELPADAYLAKAHELAQQGRYREAIGQLLWGGMSSIERAELIRHRRGLTLRDYLRSLRGKTPHYDGFKSMIRLYEPVGFGRRVASYQTFQDALAGYEQAVVGLA